MVSSLYRNSFSARSERVQGRADLGDTYESLKADADKFIRATNRNNLSKRQEKIRAKRQQKVSDHVNTTNNAKVITKFVSSDNVVTEVCTKKRFNPTRAELQTRKVIGLAVISRAEIIDPNVKVMTINGQVRKLRLIGKRPKV